MAEWEEFELSCTKYLNTNFGSLASFIHEGGSNSTVSDIRVETRSGKKFYMDVKHSPAQCGQFVLLPNISAHKFEYSKSNANPLTASAQMIISYMNQNFEAYKEAGTAGKNIDFGDGGKVFADWIIETYKKKKTYFFITNDYTILPVTELLKYFYVTASYRIKRSGSSSVGKSNVSDVYHYINTSLGYGITEYQIKGGKLFVKLSQQLEKDKVRFYFKNSEYLFSERNDQYEIRKLSNTFHANVIFSIQKKSIQGLTKNEFADILR